MKSAPAVIMWAMGLLNSTTPAAMPGSCEDSALTWASSTFLPVPSTTICAGGQGQGDRRRGQGEAGQWAQEQRIARGSAGNGE
jgi:hypothetical protein